MADTKGSNLNPNTAPIGTDLIVMVDDPGGTPETQGVTFANATKGLAAATTSAQGAVPLATGAEVNTGTDAAKAVTPDALDDWTGSAQVTTVGTLSAGDVDAAVSAADLTTPGKVEIADVTETNTGTDATRAVSPDGLDGWTGSAQVVTVGTLSAGDVTAQVSAATEGLAGKLEIANNSEATTGTNDTLALTPLKAQAMIDNAELTGTEAQMVVFNATPSPVAVTMSGDVTVAAGGAVTIANDAVTLAMHEDATQGDILYYGASGVLARLGFGTDGQFLKTQGTGADPVWTTPPGGGDVLKVGTPVDNQVGVWTGNGTIEGKAGFTYDDGTTTMTVTNFGATTWTGAIAGGAQVLSEIVVQDYAIQSSSVSSSSNTTTFDYANGPDFTTTLSEDTTFVFTGWPATGDRAVMTIEVTQDAATPRTVTISNVDTWEGGTAWVMSTGVDDVDEIAVWTRNNGTATRGAILGQDFS